MYPQVRIKRDPDLHHAARRHIPDQRDAGQCARGKRFVTVDDVLVATDEDAEDAVAEEDGGDERGPVRDSWVGRPAHPKKRNWDGGSTEHTEPKAELRGEAMTALGFDIGEVALGPDVDNGDKYRGKAQTNADAEECEAGDALGEAVGFGKDKGVAVEKGEEDNVDDSEVEGDEHDDWFAEGEEEGAIKGDAEAVEEGFFADFNLGSISIVSSEFAQVGGFPFQKNRGVGFWLEEHD